MPGIHLPPAFEIGSWERARLEVARLADRERQVLVLDAFA
jgi:hypothetical protein